MPKSKYDTNAKTIGNILARDPREVIIVGLDLDYEAGPAHPLWDHASNATPVDEAGVNRADKHGLIGEVELIRDGKFLLVYTGRGKVRDQRAANERRIARGEAPRTIPTIVRSGTYDAPGVLAHRVLENWGLRRDIPPSVKAREAQALLDAGEVSEAELCDLMGVKKGQLKNQLSILSLGANALSAIDSGWLTPTAAIAAGLTKISIAAQDVKLLELRASGEKPTVERARRASGRPEVQTPKVRLTRAADQLTAIAADLDAIIGEDPTLLAAMSTISSLLVGKTWSEMTQPIAVDEEETSL